VGKANWKHWIMGLYSQKRIQKLKDETDVVRQYQLIVELIDDGLRPVEIARQAGLKDYTVRHHARLHAKLNESVKDLFLSRKISFSLARAIAGLPSRQQEPAARKAMSRHVSVQSFRNSLRQHDDAKLMREMERLSDRLSTVTGLEITMQPDKTNAQAGNCVIRYADLVMFDVIVEKLTGECSLDDY
jgi:ParB-like chromosome segregation protein Spo0J